MTEFIGFCNMNAGFLSAIFSLLSIVLAIIAIVVSINVSRRQCRISLFEQRIKTIESIDSFCKSLYEDNFELSMHKRISKAQMVYLFDDIAYLAYEKIYSYGEKINKLQGDRQFAIRHDTCNDLTVDEIGREIFETAEKCNNEYQRLKERFFVRFAKI